MVNKITTGLLAYTELRENLIQEVFGKIPAQNIIDIAQGASA